MSAETEDKKEKSAHNMRDFKRGIRVLGKYLKRFRHAAIVAAVLAVIEAFANGVAPFLVGKLFDAILDTESYVSVSDFSVPLWVTFFAALVASWLIGGIIGWVVDRKRRVLGTAFVAYYPAQAAGRLLRLPVAFFKATKMGEVAESIQRSRGAIVSIVEQLAIGIAPEMLSVIIGLSIAFFIDPILAGILVTGVLIYVATLVRLVPPIIPLQKEGHKQWRESWGMGVDAMNNYQAIKQAAAEKYEAERIREKFSQEAAPAWNRLEMIWSSINFYQRILIVLTQTILIAVAIYFIRIGEISIGDLIALNGYAGMLFGPFARLGFQWQQVQDGVITLAHTEDILDQAPERAHDTGQKLSSVTGRVEFKNASFSYPDDRDTPVLDNISFTAEPGEVVALVGESGVGKSTTIELLSGYYYPTDGSILIDGNDTRELDLASLRRHIAVVSQEPALFNDTIRKNITYGSFDASDEEMKAAAKAAHADVFIDKFPNKYEQLVGERGVKLSVGQKQRVAIARAFLRQPQILILDEPTSALDARTEQLITESLEKLMEGRTTFIIAHRLSTVRRADKILVFDEGRIVEEGTHEELLKNKKGLYRRLHDYQIGLH